MHAFSHTHISVCMYGAGDPNKSTAERAKRYHRHYHQQNCDRQQTLATNFPDI